MKIKELRIMYKSIMIKFLNNKNKHEILTFKKQI